MAKLLKIISFIIIVVIVAFATRFFYDNYQDKIKPLVSFEQYNHNFDTINSPKEAEIYFVYKNIGTKDLIIRDVQTTCGCTIPVWSQNKLSNGQKDSLLVKYHTENKGHFVKEIMVYSNSANSPTRLKINGYVPYDFE